MDLRSLLLGDILDNYCGARYLCRGAHILDICCAMLGYAMQWGSFSCS